MSNVPKGITASDLPPLQYFFVNNSPCPQGPPGPTGPTGPRGYDGLGQGATGPTGASGPAGTVGATGPQGAIGATGAQGGPGAPFLGIGETGLAGPQGATGVRGVAGGVTIAGNPFGVVIGNNSNVGIASSNVIYSNSKLNVNGNMSSDQLIWSNTFGVPQMGSASGTNASAPLPSTPLITLSLNIVNPSTGYSLMDYPAVLCMTTMSVRNTLVSALGVNRYPTTINCTNFYMNGKFVGNMTQMPTPNVNPDVKLYQTRQFATILYRGVNYGPGISSNVAFTCALQNVSGWLAAAGGTSSNTALGEWNVYSTIAGVY